MIAVAFSRVADRLLVADPGLVRLHTALRVALACLLTGIASIAWTVFHHQPITLAAPGILFAMVAPLFVRDAQRPAWFGTLFCLYLCAGACFAAASVLSRYPLAGDAGFLAVMFVGMLVQACGPRALGCAMLGVVCFYLGLYLHPSSLHLGQSILLSVFGPLMVVLAGRAIVPMRAAASFRLAIHTVTLRASRVLAAPGATHLSALNEAALSLEEQLALLNPPDAATIRERIVEVEVAAGQLAFASATAYGGAHASADVLRRAIVRLKAMAHRSGVRGASPLPVSAASAQSAVRWFADLRTRLCWLPATRATTAAFLAMLIGHSLSPERWFWAVITTFVVFLGTRSRADTVYRGAQRLAGTLGGAVVSMVLVAPLHDSPVLLVAAMVLCVFGWAYYILSAYAPGVFFITVLVGLVYGELGFAMGPLVELRIEEVLVGCLVSFAVAILMMPLAATRHVETRLGAVLGALREVVRLAGSTAQAQTSGTAPVMRQLDRTWHDLRIALKPLQTQRVVVWNPDIELATGSLLCCLHWARVLMSDPSRRGASSQDVALNAADVGAAHVEAIVARLDSLIARYSGDVVESARDGLDDRAPVSAAVGIDPEKVPALAQLDDAVAQLFDRLTQPVARTRSVFNWALRGRSA
ncbi:FUSC family protein [Paraburkholderia caffeinilytica]|uniref:FUSC family protein n=1 Tax=Paraburkholderia caffeinilytica TaxID=1761016 RepID=UPI0038B70760